MATLASFGITFFIAIATFHGFAGLSYDHTTALWIIYIIWPLVCVIVYVVLQLILVVRTLDDRWPIGDILFGIAFYAVAQVIIFAFSNMVCDAVKHYIDGLFFFQLCMLLSVMMVYKYWDSITKEDLEFSVGSKTSVWEVKDPLLAGVRGGGTDYDDDQSNYHAQPSLVGGVSGGQLYQVQSHGYPPQGY